MSLGHLLPRRHRPPATVVLVCSVGLVLWSLPQSAPAAATSASTSSAPAPGWQKYVEAPTSATVCPVNVTVLSGTVTGAQNLVQCAGAGGATLTLAAGGTAPTIVLDYGKDVGGLPFFDVTSETGSPALQAGYSETSQSLTAKGDNTPPWSEGDHNRFDAYTVAAPGVITNRSVQGGERYEEITLTSPGTLTLGSAGMTYIADRTQLDGSASQGYFDSSSDVLNRIWYAGAYTAQLDSVPAGSLPGDWAIANGVLDAGGERTESGLGVLKQGTSWSDYTSGFETNIIANQAGWVVRSQDANNGYLFILDDSTDTKSGPNSLQEWDVHGGSYTLIGSVALPPALTPLTAGAWHSVTTTVSGATITVAVDGTRIAAVDTSSTSLPKGAVAFSSGTVGFSEGPGSEAEFRNLSVKDSSGTSLYGNVLGTATDLQGFTVPGINTLPSILDGAKRDRAVYTADMNIEGPTVYYSTGVSDYLKGALQLQGDYQLSSGFVESRMPPQNPPMPTPIPGTTGPYSASFSMYWVLDLASYYLYTGDKAFVQKEWPIVRNELAWNAGQVDSNGLFATTPADGLDWCASSARTGEVTEYNLIYYKALLDGADLATAVGATDQAASYQRQAAALKTAVNARLFDSATGLYNISDTNVTGVAQDANALAVLYGVAADDSSILAKLKTALWTSPYGPLAFTPDALAPVISPNIGGYELEARLATDDMADAETLLTAEWGHMTDPAGPNYTGTMWENMSTGGTPINNTVSLSHGWSTMPTSVLSGYVLGVRPVTAGYATWIVQPHPLDLTWADGQAPTPDGPLKASWSIPGPQQFSLAVTAPPNTTGTIAVPVNGVANPVVTVNGHVVWSGGSYIASTGSGIGGAHVDGYNPNYVKLTGVQPGSYMVAETPGA